MLSATPTLADQDFALVVVRSVVQLSCVATWEELRGRSGGAVWRQAQLVPMLTPEALPTGDSHGTPAVQNHYCPRGGPRQSPSLHRLRLQRRGHRPGGLLVGHLGSADLLGVREKELADPPAEATAPLAVDDVAAARSASVRALLNALERRVIAPKEPGLFWMIDGKPLVISGGSQDR